MDSRKDTNTTATHPVPPSDGNTELEHARDTITLTITEFLEGLLLGSLIDIFGFSALGRRWSIALLIRQVPVIEIPNPSLFEISIGSFLETKLWWLADDLHSGT